MEFLGESISVLRASLVCQMVKNPLVNAGDIKDVGAIPGLGRFPGKGHGNPLQYSCMGNPWTEEPGGLQSIGLQSVTTEQLTHTHTHIHRLPRWH